MLTGALALGIVGFGLAPAHGNDPNIVPPDASTWTDGRYIVLMDGESVATYRGGIDELDATASTTGESLDTDSAAAVEYTDHVVSEQSDVAADVGATVASHYTVTVNGFSADLTVDQALDLLTDPRVRAVIPDEIHQVTASPAETYLDIAQYWEQTGGVGEAGEGVVVGVLDTGIAPENPFFAGEPLGTTAGDEPYWDGDTIVYTKGDGEVFTGICQVGPQFTAEMCNSKIIGARFYVEGFGVANLGTEDQVPGEYVSPRDGDGHGSHTASTAAGNADVPISIEDGTVPLGSMSGVAPQARLSIYKVCWSGPDPSIRDDDGCATSDMLDAIDQAVLDGVDVINYSIGGGAASSVADPIDIAFLGAAAAGIFVSASAGNAGPDSTTLDHASPWYTTVAASTVPNYEATVTLESGALIPGGSVTVNMDPDATTLSGVLVYAGSIPADGVDPADAALCLPESLDPAAAAGMIVICDRGNNARAEKSQVAADAGAIGVVLVNVAPGSIDLDAHAIPTVHVQSDFRDALLAAAAAGETATFTPGNTSGIATPAPQVADFSSRGPVDADGGDIIKPDITAPGVAIIAAGPNAEGANPSFEFLSGTSMAAPHIAGIAAVYLSEHPLATPAEIKSAMMTTAQDTVDGAGNVTADPFLQGAGNVVPTSILDPGLLYLNGPTDWYSYLRGVGYQLPDEWVGAPIDPSNLNIASIGIGSLAGYQTITRTVTAATPGTYTASIQDVPGVDVTVEPSTLTFSEAGESQSFQVTFSVTDAATLMAYSTGFLTWNSDTHAVRSPIAVFPTAVAVAERVFGSGIEGSITVPFVSGFTGDLEMIPSGLYPVQPFMDESGSVGDQVFSDFFEVTDDEIARVITLDGNSDTADLDLYVVRIADGAIVQQWVDGSPSADEEVTLIDTTPGTYAVVVVVFSSSQDTESFTTTNTPIMPGAGEGNLTVTPNPAAVQTAVAGSYDLSWSGLQPDTSYLGAVQYNPGEGVLTLVEVESGAHVLPVPTRLSGKDRFATAVELSQEAYPDGADVVYIANGMNFPDALSAGPAAAHEGGPVLLVTPTTAPAVVLAEIERLDPDRVVIVGGTGAVSAAVENRIDGIVDTVDRIAGQDRFETSRLVVEYAFDSADGAYLVSGWNFPDALTAGAAAGHLGVPVLLVNGQLGAIDQPTLDVISGLGATDVWIPGGPFTVSVGIETSLQSAGLYTARFAGTTRYETAVYINQNAFSSASTMYITTGQDFPDALAASAIAGSQGAPLYITPSACMFPGVISEHARLGSPDVIAVGGSGAISDAALAWQSC